MTTSKKIISTNTDPKQWPSYFNGSIPTVFLIPLSTIHHHQSVVFSSHVHWPSPTEATSCRKDTLAYCDGNSHGRKVEAVCTLLRMRSTQIRQLIVCQNEWLSLSSWHVSPLLPKSAFGGVRCPQRDQKIQTMGTTQVKTSRCLIVTVGILVVRAQSGVSWIFKNKKNQFFMSFIQKKSKTALHTCF